MSKHWLYIPLPAHIDEVVTAMEGRYMQKYGDNQVLHSNVDAKGKDGTIGSKDTWEYIIKGRISPEKPLEKVKNHHTLLIGAHGSRSKTSIAVVTGTKKVGMTEKTEYSSTYPKKEYIKMVPVMEDVYTRFTHDDLADLLKMDGLSRSHRLIKLNSCYACGTIGSDPFTASDLFARLLAVALGQRKYKKVIVGGYVGTLKAQRDPTVPKTISTIDKTVSFPAKGTRRWFDADGNELSLPE
jgi:hypothetical protein